MVKKRAEAVDAEIMDAVEAIALYIVMMFGLGWMVGKMCGMNGKYEEQSRVVKEKRAGRQDVEH